MTKSMRAWLASLTLLVGTVQAAETVVDEINLNPASRVVKKK